jgi:archaellum biogenesis ATPase FlaH
MTSNLEKVIFHYILKKPALFSEIETHFFKNNTIAQLYEVAKKSYESSKVKESPTIPEIFELIKMKDVDNSMSNEVLKEALTSPLKNYRDNFLDEQTDIFITGNNNKMFLLEGIDLVQDADQSTPEAVANIREKLVELVDKRLKPRTDKTSLGLDFDDPASHNQDVFVNKVPTGWKSIDDLLNGGWDRKTFNVLMGETNIGKSVWLQNIAKQAANQGFNVIVFTLEMSDKKVVKRIGSMRLRIPIAEYDTLAADPVYVQDKLNELKRNSGGFGMFEKKLGKINIKEYPMGSATVETIEEYIKLWQETYNEKVDMIVVDYISILAPKKSLQIESMLYLKGKHLSEGLRAIAQKHDLVAITATQLSKEKFGASDINLADMPESKAIAENSDSIWGIIRNPAMKLANQYHLKALKLRDSGFPYDRIHFDFNTKYLSLENDRPVELPPM